MGKYLLFSIVSIIIVLVFSVIQVNSSFAETPSSIEQKISNVLKGTGNVLTNKQSFIVEGLQKTSYRISYPADEKELDGSVIIWSDIDGKDVKEVEISTSHYNNPESRFTAAIVLALVKTGFLSNAELNDEVFFGMIDDAIAGKEVTKVTASGYKAKVDEIIVIDKTPGLGMFFLTVEYSPKIFTSTPPPQSKKTEQSVTPVTEDSEFQYDLLKPKGEQLPKSQPTVQKSEDKIPRYSDVEDEKTPAWATGLAIFVVLGIPAIIIGLIIWKIKQRKKKNQIRSSWKGN